MTIEVPQNEEISGGRKNGGRKGVGSAIRWGGANRGAYTLRNNSKEELLKEMFIPHNQSRNQANKESLEKDEPCLRKMTTPPLAYVASEERMPDREWVRLECRAENPRIRKRKDELRLDSRIQIKSTEWDERK